ncbi:MAG: aminotransferase class I/II-fold pyridoxal phosphate-dependent enzyme [Planctomycetes bacterium]|jgi:LL-diaminopimelate aminotransferase|nr:aminotransferase class I/II-fold pyridoxal phosphate-dependent enzyme [Planctomycetota bacterium]
MNRASRRIRELGSYVFAEIDRIVEDLRRSGAAPVDFGVGDPTVPTPEFIREAGRLAIDSRARAGYPSYVGDAGYRGACAAWFLRRFGVTLDPDREVTSTIGSKEAVFHLAEAFVDPGDVVIGPDPGYPPYQRGTRFAEGEYHAYPLTSANGFMPDFDAIPESAARRAKILWICYPNSPTGAVAPPDVLARAVAWCRERNVLLASDEAYTEIYFTPAPPHSALEWGTQGVLVFHSLSKRSAMTGWRVGFVAGDAEAVAAFRKVKTNVDSGTPTFIQDAAAAAYGDEEHVARFREEYRTKRDIMVEALRAAGLPECRPEGTLYIWQRVPDGMSSVEFARALLAPEISVVVTPGAWIAGSGGGANPGEGYVRLALVPSVADCRIAAARLARFRR